ncbi:MAG: DNA mismatch repair endonuclease MutL [Lachnospiraceae bacterium]|nr:DNA mismatch repair endonuclease MutL [Lachnospiraceae bacterium]
MADIELLNQDTIDKIAAGEVVERPASVVKELVENAIDAKATMITIEIEKGGTSKIRVSDNGIGIPSNQVRKAFLRHSTSKLRDASELSIVKSLGFRGEALSSIAAVSKVELITKTKDDMLGTLYEIEGAIEKKIEEIGAPNGSNFIIRDLFYNTLPRQKFLKSPKAEGNLINEIVEKLALSHPEIAFQLSIDNKNKLSTIGSGKLKDTIYQLFGKNITKNLIEIDESNELFNLKGFICNSSVYKGNRSFENIFINNRFVKSKTISSAIEKGYEGYLMQHQYPFFCLMVDIDTNMVDVNVHPTKMEVRIDHQKDITNLINEIISNSLNKIDDIRDYVNDEVPEFIDDEPNVKSSYNNDVSGVTTPEKPFDSDNKNKHELISESDSTVEYESIMNSSSISEFDSTAKPELISHKGIYEPYEEKGFEIKKQEVKSEINNIKKQSNKEESQLSFLSKDAVVKHSIIGQLFSTYWLVEYDKSLYIIDQHAAHEKVMYEKIVSSIKDNTMSTQQISPPVIVTLNSLEETFLNDNIDIFNQVGYEIENFGGHEYTITGIPYGIYGVDAKTLFMDMIGDCIQASGIKDNTVILERIASMSCKAAVKGNTKLSYREAKELINELLMLDNPFHCPHGRPTIVKMTRYEIDKMFGRIQ